MERIGVEKLAKGADAQKVEGKGGEEDRKCDGSIALRLKRDLERVGGEWRATAKEGVEDW